MLRGMLNLKFRRPVAERPARREAEFRGFFAESVEVSAGGGFDYRWSGKRNYLALHDIRLKDGEARIDGIPGRNLRDLREKLTFAPKDCKISGWSLTENRSNSFIAFTYDPALVEQEFERELTSEEPKPRLYFNDASLAFVLRKMKQELRVRSPDKLYLETLGLWTTLEIDKLARGGVLHPVSVSGRLSAAAEKRVRDYIQTNLAKDLSLAELASVAALSRFHFLRSFRKTFGLAPLQYVLWSRVERAKIAIAEGDAGLTELSAQLGFNSPARLSAAFKRYVGCTISQYRSGDEN